MCDIHQPRFTTELKTHLAQRRKIQLQLAIDVKGTGTLYRESDDVLVGQRSEIFLAAGDPLRADGVGEVEDRLAPRVVDLGLGAGSAAGLEPAAGSRYPLLRS